VSLRYLSVCSGIEAATVAWHPLGWQPVAFSEIEPFPSAVLAHHYPNVPNLGDMTRFEEWPAELLADADILVGGSPCQAFSVAGKRESLADARGNLTLVYTKLLEAIDEQRSRAGRPPAICIWENVPGVLSTKDNAFGCFLAGLVGEEVPLQAPRGKWKDAGVVVGPQRLAAWRILDAQFFGVAQRRRRVFLVSVSLRHPRAWACAAALLPLTESVRRDSPPSRQARQGAAASVAQCFAGSRQSDVAATLETTAHDYSRADGFNMVAHALRAEGFDASEDGTGRGTPLVPVAFSAKDHGADAAFDLSPTLRAMPHNESHANGGGQMAVAQPVAFHNRQDPDVSGDITHPLGAKDNGMAVAQPIPFRKSRRAQSVDDHETWVEDGIANTLNCHDVGDIRAVDVVAQPVCFQQNTRDEVRYINGDGKIAGALAAESGMKQTNYIAQPIAIHPHVVWRAPTAGPQGKEWIDDGSAYCMDARGVPQSVAQPVAYGIDSHATTNSEKDALPHKSGGPRGMGISEEISPTLRSGRVQGVAQPVAYGIDGEQNCSEELIGTLRSHQSGGYEGARVAQPVYGTDCYNGAITGDVAATLGTPGSSVNASGPTVMAAMQVRRLTPVECERLQGFPDNYSNIPWRKSPEAPDGPRYKALGNSMAVPCMAWIGQRIAEVDRGD